MRHRRIVRASLAVLASAALVLTVVPASAEPVILTPRNGIALPTGCDVGASPVLVSNEAELRAAILGVCSSTPGGSSPA